jgi:chromosome segregation ATPase
MAAGCASERSGRSARSSNQPQELTRATASVEAAEKGGAYEHGSVELSQARRKLSSAQQALSEGDNEIAARLAEEADVDAQLATAKARSQEMQAAVAEINESIRTLQNEVRRNDLETLGRL